ncbi:Na+/H+ antiporter NhaC family protein [Soonwooa purpurea]
MTTENKSRESFISLIPFLVFVFSFLGAGIYLGDFYALPSPIAMAVGIISAFLIIRLPFRTKMNEFLKGCGDKNVLTMCIIYLLAGAFSAVAKASGSVDAIVNLGLDYIPINYIALGIFILASFLSLASGTSVGCIVALGPIAIELATKSGIDINLMAAALLTGAMFGDNLSVISDTTIAASQSLGSKMSDKFRTNLWIAAPAFLITIVLLFLNNSDVPPLQHHTEHNSHFYLLIPYILVIGLAFLGMNVFFVLLIGIVVSGIIGWYSAGMDLITFSKTSYEGFTSMTEIFLLSLLTGGLAGIIEYAGGIRFLLNKILKSIQSKFSAMFGMGILVSLVDACIANNTIAILITGKVAKPVSEHYQIEPRKMASVLDIFACIIQGIIPYGAQVLILMSFSKGNIDYLSLVGHSYYIWLLLICVFVFIFFNRNQTSNSIK